METIKKNSALILALAIPVVMILFIMLSIYIPRLTTHPELKFLYASPARYDMESRYEVVDHKIQQVPAERVVPTVSANGSSVAKPASVTAPTKTTIAPYPTIYLYDSVTDTSTEITFAQAQAYTLDPHDVSPEGYRIGRGSSGDLFIFGRSDNYNNWYLKKGAFSKQMNLKISSQGDYYYGDAVDFLGWINQ